MKSVTRDSARATRDFVCVLKTQPGKRGAKLYRGDAFGEPEQYDAGFRFTAERIECPTFEAVVEVLRQVQASPSHFVIHAEPLPEALERMAAGVPLARRLYDSEDGAAAYRPAEHRYLILDDDEGRGRPAMSGMPEAADEAYREMPEELRGCRMAFFPSAGAHRAPRLRGKWVVELARPIGEAEARHIAKRLGFDPSVCGGVQPNYFANPIFVDCKDPLAGWRDPQLFAGRAYDPPAYVPDASEAVGMGERGEVAAPDDAPADAPERLVHFARVLRPAFERGGRIESNGLLHLFGWALGQEWKRSDLAAVLALLAEPVARKRAEHYHVLSNARALEGPGAAREWLENDFDAVDEALAYCGDEMLWRWEQRVEARRAANDVDLGRDAFHAAEVREGDDVTSPVILVTRSGGTPSYFVRDLRRDDGTYLECGSHSLIATMRETNAYTVVPIHEKRATRTIRDITDSDARCIDGVEWDFSRPGGIVFDAASNRMVAGVECPRIAPRFDRQVEAWLRALASDSEARLAALHEWIASTRQDRIHRLATALLVVGPHGVGKSVLAAICARLWGALEPVDLGHVVKQFNSSMKSTPIVLDDECKTLGRRLVSTAEFRKLIADRVRKFEPKGKEQRTLHGAQRFILTCNDVANFTFADSVGVGAVDAIAERLLRLVVKECDGRRVRALLDGCRRSDGELDFERCVGHFEFIRQTVSVPDARARFLGSDPDKEAARMAVLANTLDDNAALFERVRAVLTGGRKSQPQREAALFVAAGALWVKPEGLATALTVDGEGHWTSPRVRSAIASFRGMRSHVKVDGVSIRAVEIDTMRIVDALELDEEARKQVRCTLEASAQPKAAAR